MTAAWPTPDGTAPLGPPPGPPPVAGRGPWPLAPLSVPIVLLVATLVAGVVANLVLAEMSWSRFLDTTGTWAFALVLGGLLVASLVALSLLTAPRPSAVRALVGFVVTTFAFAGLAATATALTEGFGPDPLVGDRGLLTDRPLNAVVIPYDGMLESFVDTGLLDVSIASTPFFGSVIVLFALLMAVVGAGATSASGGGALSTVLASIGAAGGAAIGELVVQYGFTQWRDAFIDPRAGPTLLVLLPIVLSGIGIGLGAQLGRPRRTSVLPGHLPAPPPHAGIAAGYVPATAPLAPAGQPLAAPEPVAPQQEPPPGGTPF